MPSDDGGQIAEEEFVGEVVADQLASMLEGLPGEPAKEEAPPLEEDEEELEEAGDEQEEEASEEAEGEGEGEEPSGEAPEAEAEEGGEEEEEAGEEITPEERIAELEDQLTRAMDLLGQVPIPDAAEAAQPQPAAPAQPEPKKEPEPRPEPVSVLPPLNSEQFSEIQTDADKYNEYHSTREGALAQRILAQIPKIMGNTLMVHKGVDSFFEAPVNADVRRARNFVVKRAIELERQAPEKSVTELLGSAAEDLRTRLALKKEAKVEEAREKAKPKRGNFLKPAKSRRARAALKPEPKKKGGSEVEDQISRLEAAFRNPNRI